MIFFQILVTSQNTEILIESYFWLGMYGLYMPNDVFHVAPRNIINA